MVKVLKFVFAVFGLRSFGLVFFLEIWEIFLL